MSLLGIQERLRAAMDAANLNQADLARRVGLSRSAVNQLLQGTSKGMKPHNLVSFARALGVRVEWLATGEMPMNPEKISEQDRELLRYLRGMPAANKEALLHVAKQLSG